MPGDSTNLNTKAVNQNTYDAIVIGSGISGGWAAKQLTEKGLEMLVLERGNKYDHKTDYKSEGKDAWEFEHRGKTTEQQLKDYPVVHGGWDAFEPIMDAW